MAVPSNWLGRPVAAARKIYNAPFKTQLKPLDQDAEFAYLTPQSGVRPGDKVVVPFNSTGYKPVWVGLGQIGFYLLAIVGLSFYVRKRLGNRTWHLIHYLSFLMFVVALLHGVLAGTDSTVFALRIFYWATGASLLFLFVYRIFVARFAARKPTRTAT